MASNEYPLPNLRMQKCDCAQCPRCGFMPIGWTLTTCPRCCLHATENRDA